MKKEKILFIERQLEPGLVDGKLSALAPGLSDYFHITICHVPSPPGNPEKENLLSLLPLGLRVKNVLHSVRFDCVLVRNILDVPFLRSPRLLNDRLLLEVSPHEPIDMDGDEHFLSKQEWVFRKKLRKAAKAVKEILLEGNHQMRSLKKFNLNVRRIPPLFPSVLDGRKERRRVKFIGFAGTGRSVSAMKSMEGAFARISKEFPSLVFTVSADRFVKLDPPVRYLYNKLTLEKATQFFSSLDLFIYPAGREDGSSCGNSPFILHAMAHGVPCVVWRGSIDEDVYVDGRDLFLVSSEEELYRKLTLLVRNRDLREMMAENAYKRGITYFSREVVSRKYLETLREVTNRK